MAVLELLGDSGDMKAVADFEYQTDSDDVKALKELVGRPCLNLNINLRFAYFILINILT